ncbi:MAG: hypothetical protein WD772_02555 [Pseudohongiellaceae bacterium]
MATESQINVDPRKIFTASLTALALAVVLLFTVILPAEFEFDPLGTGRLLGLDALAGAGNLALEDDQLEPHRQDFVEFHLEPFQSVEYKYQMDLDAPMVFSWSTDGGEVYYDMHAEPAGLGAEYAESFGIGNASAKMGTYHAPFAGIHGWFWENRGRQAVELRLYSAGFYVGSTIFGDGGEFQRNPEPVFE